MKRLTLTIIAAGLLFSIPLSASQLTEEEERKYWEEYHLSVEIHHPLLAKVFPGVIFEEKYQIHEMGNQATLTGRLNGKYYPVPDGFNLKYAEIAERSKASDVERMEAFICLTYWERDKELEIYNHESGSYKFHGHKFNHRFVIGFHTENGVDSVEVYIDFHRDQIIFHFYKPDEEGNIGTPPILINSLDNFQLEVLGVQAQSFRNIRNRA